MSRSTKEFYLKRLENVKGEVQQITRGGLPPDTSSPAGEQVQAESFDISKIDTLLERSLSILNCELSKIEQELKTKKPLPHSRFDAVTDIADAVIKIKKGIASSGKAKENDDRYHGIEKELSTMGKGELLAVLLPYMDLVGIDITQLPVKIEKEIIKDEPITTTEDTDDFETEI